VLQVPRQKGLLRREHRNGSYAVGPWLAGYLGAVALVEAIATLLFVGIIYGMVHLEPKLSSIAALFGALALSILACAACGIALGGAFRDFGAAREFYAARESKDRGGPMLTASLDARRGEAEGMCVVQE